MFSREHNRYHPHGGEPGAEVFPYVVTTYRLTEHHTAGGMSRWLPYLSELQPEMFCEVSPELAEERGLRHLDWATIVTARGVIEARVLATDRMTPLRVQGRAVHQTGLPYPALDRAAGRHPTAVPHEREVARSHVASSPATSGARANRKSPTKPSRIAGSGRLEAALGRPRPRR